MRYKLTDAECKKLAPPATGNKLYYDEKVDGFALRVTANDARSFVLVYRNNRGRERRLTIGKSGRDAWSTIGARTKAETLKREITMGSDPLEKKRAEREAPTISDLADDYRQEKMPTKRPRSQAEDEGLLKIILGAIGKDKVADVTEEQIGKLHRKITRECGPFRANRMLALLSSMMAFAKRSGDNNPCKHVARNPEPKRERFLDEDKHELTRLHEVLDADEDLQAADVFRLSMLTGARIGELVNATWSQFKLDGERPIWTKPYSGTKQKKNHYLPLALEAVDILNRLERRGPYVFPSKESPLKPRTYDSIEKRWRKIRKAAGLADVRIHDFRHSHASFIANAGGSLLVIGAALGHSSPTTTARYAHIYDSTLRAAVKSVGAKVVPMKKGA